jgi:hypothetical protein
VPLQLIGQRFDALLAQRMPTQEQLDDVALKRQIEG